jgi:hypothetical protein
MNSETYDEHPAFVEIIKQLCSDECKMLRYICEDFSFPMIKIGIEKENNTSIDVYPYFSDICFKCGCEYPIKFPEYLDNLKRLGLVDVDERHFMSNDAVYQVLRDNLYYSIRTSVLKSGGNTIKENKGIFEISEFGKVFCSVCMDIPMEKIKQPKKK